MLVASENYQKYIDSIQKDVDDVYALANEARAKGLDPDKQVSIPLARDMAERVEGIISVAAAQIKGSGVSQRIQELEKEYGLQDWRVAFTIALEVSQQKFCKFEDKREACEVGLRVGMAYITNGVVSSPLEGFIRLELKKRNDGSGEFFSLYFGGPIRSAGTTATCAFIYLADYVRKNMGYAVYDPSPDEIKRASTELDYFHERITNLQYLPHNQESEFLTKHLPLQMEGDGSEKLEVPNYKDLARVSTNVLRNGYCLAMAEGMCQKGKKSWGKFSKWYKDFGMEHWSFMADFVKLQNEVRSKGVVKKETAEKITPDYTFVKDIVAGRPVLGYPMRRGGFRIRFGRTRTSGFSSDAFSPATLSVLDDMIAKGTQLKVERPGKATSVAICDSIEGPVVKLKDGSVVFVESEEQGTSLTKEIEEVIYLGDVLINYGDFFDRAHVLFPPGYCEEWWVKELSKSLGEDKAEFADLVKDPFTNKVSFDVAYSLSEKHSIPLYPKFTYHWIEITPAEILNLFLWVSASEIVEDRLVLPLDFKVEDETLPHPKRSLEIIGCPHKVVSKEFAVVEGDWAKALKCSLGSLSVEEVKSKLVDDSMKFINSISDVVLRDKSGLTMGGRMGRPEKGKMRKLTGSPHGLFPIGEEGGRMRSFQAALEKGYVNAPFPTRYCPKCEIDAIYPYCHKCEGETTQKFYSRDEGIIDEQIEWSFPYKQEKLNIREYFDHALKRLGSRQHPELIKGIRSVANKNNIPEPIEKGILRAKHRLHVNKDGTIRFDMSELTCTHFKPSEIGTPIERLKEIGYEKDVYGEVLVSDDQILELKGQDLILPSCPGSLEEGADQIMFRVANFLDELLIKHYKVDSYYNLKTPQDLVGHLCVGLSPHTAAGIVCRIIGFSQYQGMLAHPYLHSFMRRDTDGDEAGIMLILDAFLNFSQKLLSNHRGATQDEPLVLSSVLIPAEVDDMVFNMDTVWEYPLEFYEAACEYKYPWDIKMERVEDRLGKESQFEGYGFTHPTSDFNAGVKCSSYKTLPTMEEKVMAQMHLAEICRSVTTGDVAALTIERHFLRDIKGNLRKFSQQRFRCVSCNGKYRRPPLKGACTKCGGKIIFTISEGSVLKYLEPSLSLAKKYNLPVYLQQTLELLKQRIEMVFGKDNEKQEGLGKWFVSPSEKK
jgi:DNA polymerase II large subunit